MDKICVKIFLPTRSCACSYADFVDKVDSVLRKYREHLDVRSISSYAPEAANYDLTYSKGLVINEKRILGPLATESQMEDAIVKELKRLKATSK